MSKGHSGASEATHGGGSHVPASHEEPHEGAPEWLISFADNVTLMMGFFVILLAFNLGPKGGGSSEAAPRDDPEGIPMDMSDVAIAVRDAFNNPVTIDSSDPNDQPLVRRLLERRGAPEARDDGPKGAKDRVQSLRPGEYYAVCGVVVFEQDTAKLDAAARRTLVGVANYIRGLQLEVDVRGHVSIAEAADAPERGMRLSFERAVAVAHALVDLGVEWRQIRIHACGVNDRVQAPAYDADAHHKNQRVEVVVTDKPAQIPLSSEPGGLP